MIRALVLWLFASTAAAQGAPQSADAPSTTDHWSKAQARWFAAGLVDMGGLVRARGTLGYGKPYWTWAGVEGEAVTTTEMAFTTVRARVALVIADLAVAYRYTWSYRRRYLAQQDSYDDDDLRGHPHTRYHSLDTWLWGLIPAGDGLIDWEFEASHLYGLPRGMNVFEEWFRTPIRPAWVTACRLGYMHMFMHKRLAVGAMGEWVWPGPRGSLARVGPLASYAFGPHWDFTILLMAEVHGPDDVNLFTSLWGTLRFRYKFATGERTALLGPMSRGGGE